jgi:hypothetical protein
MNRISILILYTYLFPVKMDYECPFPLKINNKLQSNSYNFSNGKIVDIFHANHSTLYPYFPRQNSGLKFVCVCLKSLNLSLWDVKCLALFNYL